MRFGRLALPFTVLVALLAPGPALAADTVVAPDPVAQSVTALDGTLVWVSGTASQTLVRRTPDGTVGPVPGAPAARAYRSIDLGRDQSNRLVLTYQRCATLNRCVAYQDDLRGRRRSIRGLTLPRCRLSSTPALWRSRSAYGLSCRRADNRTLDLRRSGLYVKTGSRTPRRLPLPPDAVRFNVTAISSVDLRGTRVGAVAADVFEYAFTETTSGRDVRSALVAASEGDSDEHALGLSLGSGGDLWSLTSAQHGGDPNQAVLVRLGAGDCREIERFVNTPGPEQSTGFAFTDVAVDAGTVHLLAPGIGIVAHPFAAETACAP